MEDFTNALIAGYDATFIRTAPPILSLTNYPSVEAMKAGESLTATEDILVGMAMLRAHFNAHPLQARIITAEEATLEHKDNYTDTQAAMLGGVAVGSSDAVQGMLSKGRGWLVELTMCWQVKPLKRSNLLNYFRSAGVQIQTSDFVMKIVKCTAGKAAKLVSIEELRTVALVNKFVAYHIAYATSGALVVKVIGELGNMAPYFFSAAEREAAQAAAAAPWDIIISEGVTARSRVITYAFLDAFDSLPENWYQGTSAWEAASTLVKRDFMMVFKQLKRLVLVDPRFREADTRDKFLAFMPDSVISADSPPRPVIEEHHD